MKKILTLFLIISAAKVYSQESENRTLESFNKIVISGNAKVYFTQSETQSVKVETKNKLNEVQTTVNNSTLRIDGKPSSVYISAPDINSINISGFGEVKSDAGIKTQELNYKISGNGKVIMPLDVQKLDIDITGLGKMKFSGRADNVNVNVSGNATINAQDLKTTDFTADIPGVAKATTDVSKNLNLNISGVGSVYYKTEPENITRNVSGIGKYGVIQADDKDTTTVRLGNKRIVIIGGEEKTVNVDNDDVIDINIDMNDSLKPPKKSRSHWAGIDLGFNNYFTDGTNTDLPSGYDFLELNTGRSLSVGVNIWKFDFPIVQRHVMLTTGIGLTLNNYRFNSNKTLLADTNFVVAATDNNDKGEKIDYIKNKLAVNYVTVPLLLQFNTHNELKKSFHIAAGVLFSYKYNSHLKLVYKENGEKQKTKRHDDFNIEPFRYDATVRLGYRNYTVFASYTMSDLFRNNRGPSLHPFTAGIQLGGW